MVLKLSSDIYFSEKRLIVQRYMLQNIDLTKIYSLRLKYFSMWCIFNTRKTIYDYDVCSVIKFVTRLYFQ
jgi:hypothetical protein